MRIEFNPGNYSINAYKNVQRNTIKRNVNINDTLEISEDALKMLSDENEIRNEKIMSIKEKIEKGTYEVNTAQIVDKMIKNVIFKYPFKKE